MKSMFAFVTGLALVAFAADAQADCGKCGAKKTGGEKCAAGACSGEKCASETLASAECDSGKGCPIAAAMARLPKLTYAVGEKNTGCPKEAARLAEESGGPIHFCVAGKEYDSESQAQTALIEATEKFVADFTKPHTCPKSGKVTLAGLPQGCEKSAAATAEKMQKAMAKVKFTYLVGEKECSCPVQAASLAKESGKEKVFVVGDEKTCCEKTARLNLARAKYKAAVEALVQAQATATKAEATPGT